ncbi:hypothetical protein VSR34_14215 [Paraburkholderia sp. JHI2823]|uniref:hypothetical protein n=1 Tax=Paraburkholderia TaxID=1822464 RepID=UPI0031797C53
MEFHIDQGRGLGTSLALSVGHRPISGLGRTVFSISTLSRGRFRIGNARGEQQRATETASPSTDGLLFHDILLVSQY